MQMEKEVAIGTGPASWEMTKIISSENFPRAWPVPLTVFSHIPVKWWHNCGRYTTIEFDFSIKKKLNKQKSFCKLQKRFLLICLSYFLHCPNRILQTCISITFHCGSHTIQLYTEHR